MDLTIVLTIGKYALLAGIYAFVLLVFRGIIGHLVAEARRERSEAPARRSRRAVVQAGPGRDRPQPAKPRAVSEKAPSAPAEAAPGASSLTEPAARATSAPAASLSGPSGRPGPEMPAPPAPDVPVAPAPEPDKVREDEAERRAPHLYVVESGDEELTDGDTVPLSAAVTIGRSEENSLCLTDRFVSSRHALICLRDGRRLLLDRGSTNGTFVNGERVDEEVELEDGDRIALGNTVFQYRAG